MQVKDFVTDLERAGRFLYLNRTCFNGLCRENKNGKFNVSIGTKNNFIYDIVKFGQYSNVLGRTSLIACDFVKVIAKTEAGDLLFVAPPHATGKTQQNSLLTTTVSCFHCRANRACVVKLFPLVIVEA